jgi:hypothetical protein
MTIAKKAKEKLASRMPEGRILEGRRRGTNQEQRKSLRSLFLNGGLAYV